VELADLRKRLLAMRSAIESMFDTPDNVDEVVELDQTRVGRLSRMDAMQLQAMAKAGQARAKVELGRIDAALRRLEEGTYGECLDCGEAIAERRLDANPTADRCVGCAEAREGAER
jgi:DnaK suppressor protein